MNKTTNHNRTNHLINKVKILDKMKISLLALCTFLFFGCGLFNTSNHDPAPDAVSINSLDEGDDFASALTRQEQETPSLRTFTLFSEQLGNIDFTLISNPNMEILGEKMFLMGIAKIGEDQVSASMTVNEFGFIIKFSYKEESYSIQGDQNLNQVFARNSSGNRSGFLSKAGSKPAVNENQTVFEKGDRYSIYTEKPKEDHDEINSHDILIPKPVQNRTGLYKKNDPSRVQTGFGGTSGDTVYFEIFYSHSEYPLVENFNRVFLSLANLYIEELGPCIAQQLSGQGRDKCAFLDDLPTFKVIQYEPPNLSPLLWTPYESFNYNPTIYTVTPQEDYENTFKNIHNAPIRYTNAFLQEMVCYLDRHPRPFHIEKNRIKMWLHVADSSTYHYYGRDGFQGQAYLGSHQTGFSPNTICWKLNGGWGKYNGTAYSGHTQTLAAGGILVSGSKYPSTLTHEVGHVFGATHVNNPDDVMSNVGEQTHHIDESNREAIKDAIEGGHLESGYDGAFSQIGSRTFRDPHRNKYMFRLDGSEGFSPYDIAGYRLKKISTNSNGASSQILQFSEVRWVDRVNGREWEYLQSRPTASPAVYNRGNDASASKEADDRYLSKAVPIGDTISYQILSPIPMSELKNIDEQETIIEVSLNLASGQHKAGRFNGTFVEILNYKGEVLGSSPAFYGTTENTSTVRFVFGLDGGYKRITKIENQVNGFRLERELQSNDPNERFFQFSEVSWLNGNGGDHLADIEPTGTSAFTGYNNGNNGNRTSSHQSNRYLSQSHPKGSTVHYQLLSPTSISYGSNNIIIQVDLNVHVLNKKGGRFNGTLVQLLDLNGEPFGTPSPKFNQVNDNTIAVQYIFDSEGNYIETKRIQAN